MKKVAFLLSFVFVAMLGMNTFAALKTVDNVVNITIVDLLDDKKPTKAEAKSDCSKSKEANCSGKNSAEAKASAAKKSGDCAPKCASTCSGKKSSATKTAEAKKQ